MHNLGKAHEKRRNHRLMGHTLLAGATGVGKTRLGELMLAQLINDGDAIIIIDPKGDKDLLDTFTEFV
jgi:conjugal transfer pilus assembly protein TraD